MRPRGHEDRGQQQQCAVGLVHAGDHHLHRRHGFTGLVLQNKQHRHDAECQLKHDQHQQPETDSTHDGVRRRHQPTHAVDDGEQCDDRGQCDVRQQDVVRPARFELQIAGEVPVDRSDHQLDDESDHQRPGDESRRAGGGRGVRGRAAQPGPAHQCGREDHAPQDQLAEHSVDDSECRTRRKQIGIVAEREPAGDPQPAEHALPDHQQEYEGSEQTDAESSIAAPEHDAQHDRDPTDEHAGQSMCVFVEDPAVEILDHLRERIEQHVVPVGVGPVGHGQSGFESGHDASGDDHHEGDGGADGGQNPDPVDATRVDPWQERPDHASDSAQQDRCSEEPDEPDRGRRPLGIDQTPDQEQIDAGGDAPDLDPPPKSPADIGRRSTGHRGNHAAGHQHQERQDEDRLADEATRLQQCDIGQDPHHRGRPESDGQSTCNGDGCSISWRDVVGNVHREYSLDEVY
tara:strand:+ start:1662 stop:3038 length:1377 start_codon:yes stop_codon:yes gene_type:complete